MKAKIMQLLMRWLWEDEYQRENENLRMEVSNAHSLLILARTKNNNLERTIQLYQRENHINEETARLVTDSLKDEILYLREKNNTLQQQLQQLQGK